MVKYAQQFFGWLTYTLNIIAVGILIMALTRQTDESRKKKIKILIGVICLLAVVQIIMNFVHMEKSNVEPLVGYSIANVFFYAIASFFIAKWVFA